jgi:hypothetical protein
VHPARALEVAEVLVDHAHRVENRSGVEKIAECEKALNGAALVRQGALDVAQIRVGDADVRARRRGALSVAELFLERKCALVQAGRLDVAPLLMLNADQVVQCMKDAFGFIELLSDRERLFKPLLGLREITEPKVNNALVVQSMRLRLELARGPKGFRRMPVGLDGFARAFLLVENRQSVPCAAAWVVGNPALEIPDSQVGPLPDDMDLGEH